MAGYVLSDDVEFLGVTQDQKEAFLEYRGSLDLDILTEVFDGADFPRASENAWPESFSYENHGTICFSVPVPHALGDYVIVTFNPSTKWCLYHNWHLKASAFENQAGGITTKSKEPLSY